jgi:hypothetical protein
VNGRRQHGGADRETCMHETHRQVL